MPKIISKIVSHGFGDPTVINCEGALNVIDNSSIDPPPIFGSLRYMLGQVQDESKMMFAVLKDDNVEDVKNIINKAVGGIEKPNTGIMFTVPISSVAGLHD